jgi:hypothetical protein
MADAEGQLETGCREPLLAGQPGVVDQQVQRQLAGVEGLRALAHAVQVAEVQRDEFGPGRAAAALGDFVEHLGGLARVAAGQKHVVAAQRQLHRGDAADAGVGAGDEGDPAVQGNGCSGGVEAAMDQTSMLPARSALVSMKSRRGSTSSPISMVNTRSASMASSICTRSRRRTAGSMVVSHSCSGFISPRPL